jgi:hypothetical protein
VSANPNVVLGRIAVSRRAPKEASMTRLRAAIAAAVIAVAMALAGAGISHTGQAKATHAADISSQYQTDGHHLQGNEMSG